MESADAIIQKVRDTITRGGIIPPGEWLEMAFDLNALIGDENDKYAEMYANAHLIQVQSLNAGETAAKSEAMMKASPTYVELLKQKGKVEQIMEFIRIAKIRGSQADREYDLNP